MQRVTKLALYLFLRCCEYELVFRLSLPCRHRNTFYKSELMRVNLLHPTHCMAHAEICVSSATMETHLRREQHHIQHMGFLIIQMLESR